MVITELQRRIEDLERRIPPRGRPVGMPGNKPAPKRPRPERTEPRKKRTHGFARRRMNPTRQVVHALDSCPECGTGMTEGWVHRTREIIEIPLVPAEVIEQVFVARMCALCRKRRLPQDSLKGMAVGRQRMGINLVSLVVTLREEGRMSIRSIQRRCGASGQALSTHRTVHQKPVLYSIRGTVRLCIAHGSAARKQPG